MNSSDESTELFRIDLMSFRRVYLHGQLVGSDENRMVPNVPAGRPLAKRNARQEESFLATLLCHIIKTYRLL